MATKLPRVNVTLSLEQYALLSRLADIQGRSRSSLLVELLETVMPVFERVALVAEAAGRAEVQAVEGFRRSVQRAQADIEPHVAAALRQYDWVAGVGGAVRIGHAEPRKAPHPLDGSGRSTGSRGDAFTGIEESGSPRPVTRGPGRGAKPRAKRARKRATKLRRRAKS